MNNKKPKNIHAGFWNNLILVWKLLSVYKQQIILISILSVAILSLNLIVPLFALRLINILFYGLTYLIQNNGEIRFDTLVINLIVLGVIYILIFILDTTKGILSANTSKEISRSLKDQLIAKTNKLPYSYFETNKKGDYISTIINDVEQVAEQVSETYALLITQALSVIFEIIMMFYLNIYLTLICMSIIPITLLVSSLIIKASQNNFIEQQNSVGKLNAYIEETIKGVSIIQIFNKQNKQILKFKKLNDLWYKNSKNAKLISNILEPILTFLNNVAYIVVIIVGAFMCISGSFTVGGIIAFNQYLNQFMLPLRSLFNKSNELQNIAASCKRIYDILNYPEDTDPLNQHIKISNLTKNKSNVPFIEFKNLSFSYDKKNIVISNFNLKINRGESIAIVGPTGAGKTTITKLLLKFYKEYSGKILINGYDIQNINDKKIRSLISVVTQNVWLFNDTIYNNVKYGNLNASSDEIYNACRVACAESFIKNLPESYNFKINETSSNLSTGQKQLISIARAIVSDKPILLFDEATSSVDTITEKEIYKKALNNIIAKKTSIIIAHRLSTIKNVDKIIVLNNGKIIEIGNHTKLMNKKSLYWQLVNASNEK